VVLLEFWLGLTVRYRLSRRHRIESPSIGLVRDLLFGGSLRFDHCFSPSALGEGLGKLPKSDGRLQRRQPGRRELNLGPLAAASSFDPSIIGELVKGARRRSDG
jgi:hypothetical protein